MMAKFLLPDLAAERPKLAEQEFFSRLSAIHDLLSFLIH